MKRSLEYVKRKEIMKKTKKTLKSYDKMPVHGAIGGTKTSKKMFPAIERKCSQFSTWQEKKFPRTSWKIKKQQ